MKKIAAILLTLTMGLSLIACNGGETTKNSSEENSEKKPGTEQKVSGEKVTDTSESQSSGEDSATAGPESLSVMIALGQWTDNFDVLIDKYKEAHPNIQEIDASFPSSDKYPDLLKAALSSGELPDIIGMQYGPENKPWHQYLADLSTDCPVYDLLTDEQKKLGTTEFGMCIVPVYVEGTGILYNLNYLKQMGRTEIPQTRDELAKYCEELTAAGIKPFMHQWAETSLNLVNWVGPTWLGNKKDKGQDFLDELCKGEDKNLDQDKEWNDFLDTYEILIKYAQDGAIATDKWTCRNAFFMEECAMLVGEGSWETPNIENTNPDLIGHVKQGFLPCSNNPDENMMQLQTISIAATKEGKTDDHVKATKDFLSYICCSEDARQWHQEKMGNPTAIVSLDISDNMPDLAKDVIATMKEGKGIESLRPYYPLEIWPDMEKQWALFVGKEISREEFTKNFEKIFKDYSEGAYK